jgi:hypothetical protein
MGVSVSYDRLQCEAAAVRPVLAPESGGQALTATCLAVQASSRKQFYLLILDALAAGQASKQQMRRSVSLGRHYIVGHSAASDPHKASREGSACYAACNRASALFL